jgi:hypothetical protein
MGRMGIMVVIVLLLVGCKQTEYVMVPEYHTDTLRVAQIVTDSVYKHDSIYIHENSDTVLIEKWHTVWQNHTARDTVYKSRVDTIAKPYPVIKEVPAELSWWQKTQMYAGDALLLLLVVVLAFLVVRKRIV